MVMLSRPYGTSWQSLVGGPKCPSCQNWVKDDQNQEQSWLQIVEALWEKNNLERNDCHWLHITQIFSN